MNLDHLRPGVHRLDMSPGASAHNSGESCVRAQRPAACSSSLLAAEAGTRRVFTEQADVTDIAALRAIGSRHKVTGIAAFGRGLRP